MNDLTTYLKGGDLRSIAMADQVIPQIRTQKDFDSLFRYLSTGNRIIMMRTADTIEKITIDYPHFLRPHKKALIEFLNSAQYNEFKWHLALLVARLDLSHEELGHVWDKLTQWVKDSSESKIVRVNSLQALYELTLKFKDLEKDFNLTARSVENENIPSINARLRNLNRL